MSDNLGSWKVYVDTVDGQVRKRAARVNARYAMAKRFRHAAFVPGSTRMQEGYSVLIKVGLAYSALEALENLPEMDKHEIHNPDIALECQDPMFDKLIQALISDLDNRKLIRRISQLSLGETTDVRPLAQGLRHLVFHGEATVNGLGLNVQVNSILRDLADVTLEFVDHTFAEYVSNLTAV